MTPAAAAVLNAAKLLTPDEQIEVIDLLSGNLPHDSDEWRRKWSAECRRVAEAEADPSLWLTLEEFQRQTDEFVASLRANRG